jgi:hypothetical protein
MAEMASWSRSDEKAEVTSHEQRVKANRNFFDAVCITHLDEDQRSAGSSRPVRPKAWIDEIGCGPPSSIRVLRSKVTFDVISFVWNILLIPRP